MTWEDRHIELVEAANAAMTQAKRWEAEAALTAFRQAVALTTGLHEGTLIMEADMHYINTGVDRPMCGGLFLDWVPGGER